MSSDKNEQESPAALVGLIFGVVDRELRSVSLLRLLSPIIRTSHNRAFLKRGMTLPLFKSSLEDRDWKQMM